MLVLHSCPHCHTERAAFQVHGGCIPFNRDSDYAAGIVVALAQCPVCGQAVLLSISKRAYDYDENSGKYIQNSCYESSKSNYFDDSSYLIDRYEIPSELFQDLPSHLSSAVSRSLKQAERNYRLPDCEETSAMAYRRAMENGISEMHPEIKGNLSARINKLGEKHLIPSAMVEWAHQIRIVGNDGAHELEGVSRAELTAAKNFTDAFLRYLVSFPAIVAERRASMEKA